jgi:hypothetical protein
MKCRKDWINGGLILFQFQAVKFLENKATEEVIMETMLETMSEKTLSNGKENSIAIRSTSATNSIPSEHEMMVFHTMAEQAVTSKMYKNIGEKAGIMMVMLAARELGISPMMSLNGGLNIIQGKVEISARMMNALIRRAGHSITIVESSDSACKLKGRRADNGDTAEVSYTIVEAQKAGLVKPGGGWTKNPKDMCFARALSRLARQLFSDVIGIGYVEGEIKAIEAEVVPFVEEPLESTEEVEKLMDKYKNIFNSVDVPLAMQYLETVKAHFKWSMADTIKELIKDDVKLQAKFESWKSKQKTGE